MTSLVMLFVELWSVITGTIQSLNPTGLFGFINAIPTICTAIVTWGMQEVPVTSAFQMPKGIIALVVIVAALHFADRFIQTLIRTFSRSLCRMKTEAAESVRHFKRIGNDAIAFCELYFEEGVRQTKSFVKKAIVRAKDMKDKFVRFTKVTRRVAMQVLDGTIFILKLIYAFLRAVKNAAKNGAANFSENMEEVHASEKIRINKRNKKRSQRFKEREMMAFAKEQKEKFGVTINTTQKNK